MGLVVPVVIATVIGLIVFRKRISGVFVSIITLALVLLVRLVVIDAQPVTNGFNGLTDLGWFKVGGLRVRSLYRSDLLFRRHRAVPGSRRRAVADRNPGGPYSSGDQGRPEPRALSRLRRDVLSDVLLRGFGRDRRPRRNVLRGGFGVRVSHLHGPDILDHDGGLGRGRRAFVDPRRLHRRHRHQHDFGDRQRNRRLRRGVEGRSSD